MLASAPQARPEGESTRASGELWRAHGLGERPSLLAQPKPAADRQPSDAGELSEATLMTHRRNLDALGRSHVLLVRAELAETSALNEALEARRSAHVAEERADHVARLAGLYKSELAAARASGGEQRGGRLGGGEKPVAPATEQDRACSRRNALRGASDQAGEERDGETRVDPPGEPSGDPRLDRGAEHTLARADDLGDRCRDLQDRLDRESARLDGSRMQLDKERVETMAAREAAVRLQGELRCEQEVARHQALEDARSRRHLEEELASAVARADASELEGTQLATRIAEAHERLQHAWADAHAREAVIGNLEAECGALGARLQHCEESALQREGHLVRSSEAAAHDLQARVSAAQEEARLLGEGLVTKEGAIGHLRVEVSTCIGETEQAEAELARERARQKSDGAREMGRRLEEAVAQMSAVDVEMRDFQLMLHAVSSGAHSMAQMPGDATPVTFSPGSWTPGGPEASDRHWNALGDPARTPSPGKVAEPTDDGAAPRTPDCFSPRTPCGTTSPRDLCPELGLGRTSRLAGNGDVLLQSPPFGDQSLGSAKRPDSSGTSAGLDSCSNADHLSRSPSSAAQVRFADHGAASGAEAPVVPGRRNAVLMSPECHNAVASAVALLPQKPQLRGHMIGISSPQCACDALGAIAGSSPRLVPARTRLAFPMEA